MSKIIHFFQTETVLAIAALAALLSMAAAPPSPAYAGYIDLPVLVLLFCLMAVVAGLKRTGVFALLSGEALKHTHGIRTLAVTLVSICFFTSMFITNDVALLTFVPLTIGLMDRTGDNTLIFTVVMETVAANLGSLLTPVGNPQNLFLFTYYNMELGEFLRLMLPLGLVSFLLIMGLMLCMKNQPLPLPEMADAPLNKKLALLYGVLFVICLLTVVDVIHYGICLLILLPTLLIADRSVLKEVDYSLLLTFVCFFIFVGNLASLPAVKEQISFWLNGRVMLASALMSQIISNVPAAVMLASFTGDAESLLLGVDIGGLGTLVASLASLISFKAYGKAPHAHKGRYLLIFTGINAALLLLLLPVGQLILKF